MPRAARTMRRADGSSLASASSAREWMFSGLRSRVPKVAQACFRFLGSRDTNRRAPEKGPSKSDGSSQLNRAAAPRRGRRGERWHELPSRCTFCVSRRDRRRRTARTATATRRARNRTRLLFRHIPRSGRRARRESLDPSVPRPRVETPRWTCRRASDAGACSRLSARASSTGDELRLERLERLLEARSSRLARARFVRGPAFVLRHDWMRRDETGPKTKRAPGPHIRERAPTRRRRVRSARPAWRPSRVSRRAARGAGRLARSEPRTANRESGTSETTRRRAPLRNLPVARNPSITLRCGSTPRRRPPSPSARLACAPCASPSRAPHPAGTSCGSRGA